MLAYRTVLGCAFSFLLIAFFHQGSSSALASPVLGERDNHLHLRCTNAPSVVAGYYLDPNKAIAPSNASATCQAQYKYLYCVPGTSTYIFFGILKSTLRPATAYAEAITGGINYIEDIVHNPRDGPIPNGSWYITTQDTDVLIYAEDANKHHLTWGVLGAALVGLRAWMAGAGNGYSDATIQINDGRNWVGNAYIGAMNEEQECVFESAFIPNTTCKATDEDGSVYGPKGGKIC